MNRKFRRAISVVTVITLFLSIAFSATNAAAAPLHQLTEEFQSVSAALNNGWVIKNNSNPIGSTTWMQGESYVFPANFGGASEFISANFNSTGRNGTISNFLITPELYLTNQSVLTFYTRTPASSSWPDRLQVLLSTKGSSTETGTAETSVGNFTTTLLTINPNLKSNGTTSYPMSWTKYTVTITGLAAPTTGRIAFRYFVTDAGEQGANSNYIGIDSVTYQQNLVVGAATNSVSLGSVTGAGTYAYNAPVTVSASPKPNCLFVNWTDDANNIISINANYSFSATSPVNLTANFARPGSIAVQIAPAAAGGAFSVDGGTTWITGTLSNMIPGIYTVTFKDVPGFVTPAPISGVNVTSNTTTNIAAEYLCPVTFRLFAGDTEPALSTQNISYGHAATAPTTPSRAGYAFVGWDTPFSNVTSGLTVNALWSVGDITVVPYFGTYDGAEHNLIAVSGTLPGDTVTYGIGGIFSSSIPVGKDAGTTAITVKVDRVGATSFTHEYSSVIDKAIGWINIASDISKTFNGAPIADPIVNTTGDGAISFTYYPNNGGVPGAKLPAAPTAPGNYFVRASIAETTNYTAASDVTSFAILPEPTPTPIPSATPTPVPTVTTTPVPTATPETTVTPTPAPTDVPAPTAIPTATPETTVTPTPAPTSTAAPTPTTAPTASPTPTTAPTATPTPGTAILSVNKAATPTPTPTKSPTTSPAVTSTPVPTATAAPTATPTLTTAPSSDVLGATKPSSPASPFSFGGPLLFVLLALLVVALVIIFTVWQLKKKSSGRR